MMLNLKITFTASQQNRTLRPSLRIRHLNLEITVREMVRDRKIERERRRERERE